MSQLLIGLAVSIALFLLLIPPHVDAEVQGTLTSAGGHVCKWRENKRKASKNKNAGDHLKTERRLRLDCECNDKDGNKIKYTCYYVSYYKECCQNQAESDEHYHSHEPAYYGQAADQLKGI